MEYSKDWLKKKKKNKIQTNQPTNQLYKPENQPLQSKPVSDLQIYWSKEAHKDFFPLQLILKTMKEIKWR